MRAHITLYILVLFFPLIAKGSVDIVQVHVFKQAIDEGSPWSQLPIKKQVYIGTPLTKNRLLVSAEAVRNARYLEIKTPGIVRSYPARVRYVDYNVQLATLEIDSSELKLKPISLGGALKLNQTPALWSIRSGSRVSYQGVIRGVQVKSSATSTYQLPFYDFLLKTSGYGWSEPLVYNNKLSGLVVRGGKEILLAIPSDVIRRYLENQEESDKKSHFGRLGIGIESLESELLRAELGLKDPSLGVWISHVAVGSSFDGLLEEGDVLLQVGKFPVTAQGKVNLGQWGLVSLSASIYRFKVGQELSLKIVRDKKVQWVRTQLKPFSAYENFIPYYVNQNRPYLVYGGLLFQQLTRNYLQSFGRNWGRRAPLYFLQKLYNQSKSMQSQSERVIFLNRVLSHKVNKGYGALRNRVVHKINGVLVRKMKDIELALSKPMIKDNNQYSVIELKPYNEKVILSHKKAMNSVDEISKLYRVPESGFWKRK